MSYKTVTTGIKTINYKSYWLILNSRYATFYSKGTKREAITNLQNISCPEDELVLCFKCYEL